MKREYLDEYGIDSLRHLRLASLSKCEVFVTNNQDLLKDRGVLEEEFHIKIRTPEEMVED
jgi:predicted nucleic acid-binding protein